MKEKSLETERKEIGDGMYGTEYPFLSDSVPETWLEEPFA